MARIRQDSSVGAFDTFFAVTEGIETYELTLDGFDRDKGVLLGAELTVTGTVTASAFLFDLFGGFGTIGSAFVTVGANFDTPRDQPDLISTGLLMNGFDSAYVPPFGQALALPNATGLGVGIFPNPGQFKDDQDVTLQMSVAGGFTGIPFGTLPQGDVIVGAEITYTFVKEGQITEGARTADRIAGTAESDVIFANGGNDRISAKGGEDYVRGGGGRDTLGGGKGDDQIAGGKGNDRLSGAAGDDLLLGDDGNDRLNGGKGEDTLFGGAQRDTLKGQGSADVLYGGGGGDHLDGGSGEDSLDGGGGSDTLFGGAGDDELFGGRGDDLIDGGLGTESYTGGAGADLFVFRADDVTGGAFIKDFGTGADRIDMTDFNLSRRDVTIEVNDDIDEVVIVVEGGVIAVLEGVEREGVTMDMILF